MRTQTQQYLRRFSLWLLGQALPETGALRKPARLALTSVLVASAAGTLIALSVVALLVAFYFHLMGLGFTEGESLAAVAATGFATGLGIYWYAQKRMQMVPDTLDELQLFSGRPTDLVGEVLQMVLGGFVEGMAEKEENVSKKAQDGLQEALDAILARLETLEERTSAETENVDVVLEIERASRGRRKAD